MKREYSSVNKRLIKPYPEKHKFLGFRIDSSNGNCKLETVENLGPCLRVRPNETIEALKKYLTTHTFFVHLSRKAYIDLLDKHFERIYCNSVAIGYDTTPVNKYQYHALYFSGVYNTYVERVKKDRRFTDEQLNKIQQYKSKHHLENYLMKLI